MKLFKIGFSACLLISTYLFGCLTSTNNVQPVKVGYFKPGQILFPDYACSDTLIVNDAEGLNYAMGFIEQGIIDGTDGDIDSILHTYCRIK